MAAEPRPRPDPRRRRRLGTAGPDAGRASRRGLSAGRGSRSSSELLHLVAHTELVHVPNTERPRLLVPLEPAAVRFALERLGRETWPWRIARLAGRIGLGRALLAARFPVRSVAERHGEESLLDLTGEPGPFVAHVGSEGNLVVYLLRGGEPASVAKVSADPPRLEREARALREVGELAREAGAEVPRPLALHHADGVGVLVETPVAGRPLAWTLPGSARRFPIALTRLADWLAAWHGLTARSIELTRELLEAELLGPAKDVAEALEDGGGFLHRLEKVCRRAEGMRMPLVATHGDLTSLNVLGDEGRLGIVDWEHARADGWPLTDLVYAAADMAAALDRHRDRIVGFDDCFLPHCRWTDLAARLERRLSDGIGLTKEAAELCFQVCWTRHAANELRATGGRAGAFVALAERAALLYGTR